MSYCLKLPHSAALTEVVPNPSAQPLLDQHALGYESFKVQFKGVAVTVSLLKSVPQSYLALRSCQL